MPYTTNFSSNHHHHRFNRNPNRGGGSFDHRHHRSSLRDDSISRSEDRKRPRPSGGDNDSGGYAKLFVTPVPRRAPEDVILPLFEEHGHVVELVFIKDKCTGQSKRCCFVKYASLEEAGRAITALNNQYTLPGERNPIVVRFADEKRETLGESESLYVAELNKLATEKEIEEIFSPYGQIEDIMILRDDLKQSRGMGFVKFLHKDMAIAAISALHGTYAMRGCDQPLIVRFAVPKRKKTGESWSHTAFQCSGFGPEIQDSQGIRSESNHGNPTSEHMQPNARRQKSPQNSDSSSPVYDFSSHSVVKSDAERVLTTMSSSNRNMRHPVARTPTGHSYPTISFASSRVPCMAATNPICEWSEHTCPDGFKYYYNCITKESRWEQPEEFTSFKQRQQKLLSRIRAQCREQNSVASTDFVSHNHSSAMGSDAT